MNPFLFTLKKDHWLTEKMGCSTWRVEQSDEGESLSRLKSNEPFFAYTKVAAKDLELLWHLNKLGFRVVDLALTFEGAAVFRATDIESRFATVTDRDAIAHIAATAFRYSRFHLDPLIPLETANVIKSEWATNYFYGKRGDGMVVADQNGKVAGFLQLFWQGANCLVIDLIGVGEACQGKGLGRSMIHFASKHGTNNGRVPERIRVGTQAANIQSVRFYESLGFKLVNSQYVLHCHHQLL